MSKTIDFNGVPITVDDDDPRLPPASTLASTQAAQVALLTAACAAQIVGGYASSALGAVHTYPAKDTDQANMTASVTDAQRVPPAWQANTAYGVLQDVMAGNVRLICQAEGTTGATVPSGPGADGSVTWAAWYTPFWCEDASGTWAFQPHTAAQIQQAGADGKIAVLMAQNRLVALTTSVMAATITGAVTAITW